jgi:molecular chaperone GrpE
MSTDPQPDTLESDADPEAPADPVDALRAEVERLTTDLTAAQAKAQENWDTYLRALAENDNVRKRAQRDLDAAQRFAVERFAADLLEVRDSLELGIAAGAGADAGKLVEGMDATLRLLNKAFERAGLAVIDPAGQPFNPEFHEAMVTQPSADQAAGTVLAVVQKGYSLNGRLLRPARVVIARAPDAAS